MNKHALIESCSPNFKKFFKYAEAYCLKHNKKITLKKAKKTKIDGCWVRGWCDGNEMVVCTEQELFKEVFVHEFSHLTQAVDESPFWEADFEIWDHLGVRLFEIKDWDRILATIALERDCEQRSIKLSKKFNLFDNESYAQRANSYLSFYHYVFLKSKWENSVKPYTNKKIVSQMPKKIFTMKQLSSIDMNIMTDFEKSKNIK